MHQHPIYRIVTLAAGAAVAVVSGVLTCGCASEPAPYQRATRPSGKGYSEKIVSPDTFFVKYVARAGTPEHMVSDYLHRRAAELTLRHGFRYFTVLRGPSRTTELDTREIAVRDQPRKWQTEVVEVPSRGTLVMAIQCFKDPSESPDMPVIDAGDYLKKGPGPRE